MAINRHRQSKFLGLNHHIDGKDLVTLSMVTICPKLWVLMDQNMKSTVTYSGVCVMWNTYTYILTATNNLHFLTFCKSLLILKNMRGKMSHPELISCSVGFSV